MIVKVSLECLITEMLHTEYFLSTSDYPGLLLDDVIIYRIVNLRKYT